jgi:hypothetical protein
MNRIATITSIAETLQILKYEEGQFYKTCDDYAGESPAWGTYLDLFVSLTSKVVARILQN